MSTTENYSFKTEDKRLLDLVINSLYSEKDIFLRELISNASDAIGKLKFQAIANPSLIEQDSQYQISIKIDKDLKALIISDNGIGMSKEELIENLGTIARSGSHEFINSEEENTSLDKSDIIGQFGVGFYSVFMVAHKVDVFSTKAGSNQAHKFSSEGAGTYSVEDSTDVSRGTKIVVHLKDDNYLDQYTIRQIVEKYSQYTAVPIYLEHWVEAQAQENVEGETPAKTEASYEKEVVNDSQPLWLTSKSNISEEQYNEFYKTLTRDFRDPLTNLHSKVEGQSTYSYLLYIPSEKPFYLLSQEKPNSCKLHVKRIFITDDSEKLLPRYLGFVSGVVDFQDLPLNVSRELLQENKVIQRTKKALTKKVLSHLNQMAKKDNEKYMKFWNQFGAMLKMFPNEDHENKDTICPLLRFKSTFNDDVTSIDDYISRMKEGQDKIYFIAAPTLDAALHSPHMDYFKDNNIEVLLLLDKIDESLLSYMSSYKDKNFVSVTSSDISPTAKDSEDKKDEEKPEENPLCKTLEEVLKDKVKAVKVSTRLSSSPACLVVEGGATMYMQRLMQEAGQAMPSVLPTMEINLEHSLVKKMLNKDQGVIEKWGQILYSLAMLAEGGNLSDPATFAREVTVLLENSSAEVVKD